MIDPTAKLSVSRQAGVLGIRRGSVYYKPRPVSDADLKLMHRIDTLHMEFPFAGSRMLRGLLVQAGFKVGRLHVATLMKRMGIEALYRKPNTSNPAPGHKSLTRNSPSGEFRGRSPPRTPSQPPGWYPEWAVGRGCGAVSGARNRVSGRALRSTPICCGSCPSPGPTRSGRWTSPIFPWRALAIVARTMYGRLPRGKGSIGFRRLVGRGHVYGV